MSTQPQILIADDQRLFAESLRGVIESRAPQFVVLELAENGKQAVRLADKYRPEIVLMDVRMPEMDGVEATRIIHEKHPEIKILILTTFPDEEYVNDSLRYGAVGYLLKNRPAEELLSSITALASGTEVLQIDPVVSRKLFKKERKVFDASGENEDIKFRLQTLSPREREVLKLMVDAKRILAIARELDIAEQTVRNHVSNIYFKLGIHDRLEIVNYIDPIKRFLKEISRTD